MRRLPTSWSDSFLARLGYRRKKSRRPYQSRRSLVEALESRMMLSATPNQGVSLPRAEYVIVSEVRADQQPSDQFVVYTEYAANGTPRAVVTLRDGLTEIDDTRHTLNIELQLGASVLERQEVLVDIESEAFRQQFLQDRLERARSEVVDADDATLQRLIDALVIQSDAGGPAPSAESGQSELSPGELGVLAKSLRAKGQLAGGAATSVDLYGAIQSKVHNLADDKLAADTAEARGVIAQEMRQIGRAALFLADRVAQDLSSSDANVQVAARSLRDELVSAGNLYYTLFTGLGVNQEVKQETLDDGRLQVFGFLEAGTYELTERLRIELGNQQAMVQVTTGPGFSAPLSDYTIPGPLVDTYVNSEYQNRSQPYGTLETLEVSQYSTTLISWNLNSEQGKLPTTSTLTLQATDDVPTGTTQTVAAYYRLWVGSTPTTFDGMYTYDDYADPQDGISSNFLSLGNVSVDANDPTKVTADITEAVQRALLLGDSNLDGSLNRTDTQGKGLGDVEAFYQAVRNWTYYVDKYDGVQQVGIEDLLYRNDANWDGIVNEGDIVSYFARLGTGRGDYNLDGSSSANGADYGVWSQNYGRVATRFSQGDGNFDGVVNDADMAFLQSYTSGAIAAPQILLRIEHDSGTGAVEYGSSESQTMDPPTVSLDYSPANFSIAKFVGNGNQLEVKYRVPQTNVNSPTIKIYQVTGTGAMRTETEIGPTTATLSGTISSTAYTWTCTPDEIMNPSGEYSLLARVFDSNGTVLSEREFDGGVFQDNAGAWHVIGGIGSDTLTIFENQIQLSGDVTISSPFYQAPANFYARTLAGYDSIKLWNEAFEFAWLSGGDQNDNYEIKGDLSQDATLEIADASGLDTFTKWSQTSGVQDIDLTSDQLQELLVYDGYTLDLRLIDTPIEVVSGISTSLVTGPGYNGLPIVVDTLSDLAGLSGEPDDMSLRKALRVADAIAGSNAIEFSTDVLNHVIELANGQLSVASDVSISVPGASSLTIDAQGNSRVIGVGAGVTAALSGLTITGGGNVDQGAGIHNYGGNLTLTGVRVVDNSTRRLTTTANDNGGGIYSVYGSLHLLNSTVDGNRSEYNAGVSFLADDANDVLEISGSTISNNVALDLGGSGSGGALGVQSYSTSSVLTVSNSTISGNSASYVGAVSVSWSAHLTIANTTITENSSTGPYGGIFVVGAAAQVKLDNSIVAGNDALMWSGANRDVARSGGTFDATSSNNLIGVVGTSGLVTENNLTGTTNSPRDPGLAPLGDYGGPTKSHALLPNSEAINAGDPNYVPPLDADQRGAGYLRILDGRVDIGAVEAHVIQRPDLSVAIYGTELADTITLVPNQVNIDRLGTIAIDLTTAPMIDVAAMAGDDLVTVDYRIANPLNLYGGAGNDTLYAGGGPSYIDGGDDDDQLFGSKLNDTIVGGAGDDQIWGGAGDDSIDGDAGGDVLFGEEGADTIHGGDDDDTIYGGSGDDALLSGDEGDDVIYAGAGNDLYVVGGAGNDYLYGEAGADVLSGGEGDDVLDGGLSGEYGTDHLDGGAGDDRYFVTDHAATAADKRLYQIEDAEGSDTIDLSGWEGTTGVTLDLRASGPQAMDAGALVVVTIVSLQCLENVVGTARDDTIYGTQFANRLAGGAGDDTLYGDAGDDWLEGGPGNDRLYGEVGVNVLAGGLGDDTYFIDEGATADRLDESGAGKDTIDFAAWTSDVTVDLTAPTQTVGNVQLNVVDDLHDGGSVEQVIGTQWVIDNADARYSEASSSWKDASFAGGVNGGQRVVDQQSVAGSQSATWTFTGFVSDQVQYEVYVTWEPSPIDLTGGAVAATNAAFTVNGTTVDLLDQRVRPSLLTDGVYWQRLTIGGDLTTLFTPNNGDLTVGLSNAADGAVFADAVRLVPYNPAPQIDSLSIEAPGTESDPRYGLRSFEIGVEDDLSISVTVSDGNELAVDLDLELVGDVPEGIALLPTVTAGEWEILWDHQWTEGQATVSRPHGTFALTLRVSDHGAPARSSVQTIFVVSGDPNTAPPDPVFANVPIGVFANDEFTWAQDAALEFNVQVTDAESTQLYYSLSPNAPAGASIDSAGHFSWHPASDQRSVEPYEFDIRVTDDGNPPLRKTIPVTIHVNIDSAPEIDPGSLKLQHDTGVDGDGTTADLTLVGTVTNDGSFDFVQIEVDYSYSQGNFSADDVFEVEADADTFGLGRFVITPHDADLPRDGSGDFVPTTIAVRARQWIDGATYLTGSTQTVVVTPNPDDNMAPHVVVGLLNSTGSQESLPTAIDPTIRGTVTNDDGDIADLLVKIYVDDPASGGQPIATTRTDAAGSFTCTHEGLTTETTVELWFVAVESTTFGEVASDPLSGHIEFIYEENQSPTIADLAFVDNTLVRGRIEHTDGSLGGITIEFDDNLDDQVDGVAVTDAQGWFEYLPIHPGTLETDPARHFIAAQAAEFDTYRHDMLIGDWSLPLAYPNTENAAPEIDVIRLKYTPNADGMVADPKIVGSITNDTGTDGVLVEYWAVPESESPADPLDSFGRLIEVSGVAIADADGHFEFVPVDMEPNVAYRVYAQAVEWDLTQDSGSQELADNNSAAVIANSITVTLSDTPLAPDAVTGFGLKFNTGTLADNITADPTIEGTIVYYGDAADVIIEFDHGGDGTVDGTAVPDENGYFTYVPAKLAIDQPNEPITIRARVRVPDYSVHPLDFDGVGIDWYTNGYDSETGTWNTAANVDEWLATIFSESGGFAGDWYNSSFTRDWDSLFADYTTGFDYSVQFRLDPTAITTLTVGNWDRVDASNPYNPTVTGTVQPAAGQQANVAALTVEFYLGGTLDGSTTTDADGVFYHTLRTARPGENEVTVRIIEPQYGSETLRVTDVGTFIVLLDENLNLHAATPTLMNGWVDGSDAWHAIDPTLVGTVTGFENPALRTVEFDYYQDGQADGRADGRTLTDGLGRYSFAPVGIGAFKNSAGEVTVRVRAVDFQVDLTTGESYSVYGDWNSTALTWHVEANAAPVITQFELAYDAVNRVEGEEPNVETWQELDRVTSDPTLVGRVMDSNAQAFVTVEFDHNGDEIVDGTTTTDENGFFRYVPVGLTAGFWDIRARVREFDPVKEEEPQLDLGWARVTAQGVPFAYDASGDLIIDAAEKATDAASPFYGFTLVPAYSGSTTLQPLDHTASDYDPTLTGTVLDDDGLENTTVSFYYMDGDDQVSLGSTTPRADGTFEFTPLGLPFSDTTQTGDTIRVYATAHKWDYLNAEEITLDEVFYDLHFIPYPNESNFAATTAAADSSIDPIFTGSVNVPSTVVSTGTASFTVDLVNPLYVEVSVDGEFVTTVAVEDVDDGSSGIRHQFTYHPPSSLLSDGFATEFAFRPVGMDENGYVFGGTFNASVTYEPNLPTIIDSGLERWTLLDDPIEEDAVQESINPTISGTVDATTTMPLPDDPAYVQDPLVEFDLDGDGTVDDTADATYIANHFEFTYTLTDAQPGDVHVRARAVRFEKAAAESDAERDVRLEGEWQTLSFTILDARPRVEGVALADDIGTTHPQTTVPKLTGDVSSHSSPDTTGMTVEVDHNGDGIADGRAIVRSDQKFEYAAQNLKPGNYVFQFRAVDSFSQATPLTGEWTPFSFELIQILPELEPLTLVYNEDPSVPATTNPLISGKVTDPNLATRVVVEFDHDGDDIPDGSATADVFGEFTYNPAGLRYGTNAVRARVVAQFGSELVTGPWDESLDFFYRSSVPPIISNLTLVDEANGIVRGRATVAGFGARVQVELGVAQGPSSTPIADGRVMSDSNGAFAYQLRHTSAGSYYLKVRAISTDSTGTPIIGDWQDAELAFTYDPDPVQTPELTEFQLAYDPLATGETPDPTVRGQVAVASFGTVVELDLNGNNGADVVVPVQRDGSFEYVIPNLADNETKTVHARWRQFDPVTGNDVPSPTWTEVAPVTMTLRLGAAFNAAAAFADFGLAYNTSAVGQTPRSSQPVFSGQVGNDGRLDGLTVVFDHDNNGVIDGSTITRADGSFVYRATGLTPSATSQSIRAWVVETTYDGQIVADAPIETYSFILTPPEAGASNTPTVTDFTLVEDTQPEQPDNRHFSSNTTTEGAVELNLAGERPLVEIVVREANGDPASKVRVQPDSNGGFTYRPDNADLPLGVETTLNARSVFWNAITEEEEYGDWMELKITRLADEAPTIVDFDLLHSVAPLTDPTVKGTVLNDGRTAGLRIEFDVVVGGGPSDGQADGFAFTDENGDFEFTPYGLAAGQTVTIYARVVEWNGDSQSYEADDFGDYQKTFTLTANGPAEPQFQEDVEAQRDIATQAHEAFTAAVAAILEAANFGDSATHTGSFQIGQYTILERGGTNAGVGELASVNGVSFDAQMENLAAPISDQYTGSVSNLVTPRGYVRSADYTITIGAEQNGDHVEYEVDFLLSNIQYEEHVLFDPVPSADGMVEQRATSLNITGGYTFSIHVEADLTGSGQFRNLAGSYELVDTPDYDFTYTELVLRDDSNDPNDTPVATTQISTGNVNPTSGGSTPSGEFDSGVVTSQPYYYVEIIDIDTLVDESGTEITGPVDRLQTRTFDTYEHTVYHEERVDSGSINYVDGQAVAQGTLTIVAWATLVVDDSETVDVVSSFADGVTESSHRTTHETANYRGDLSGSVSYTSGEGSTGNFEFSDSFEAAFHEIGDGTSALPEQDPETWNYELTSTLNSESAASGTITESQSTDGTHTTAEASYSSAARAELHGSGGGTFVIHSGDTLDGGDPNTLNYTQGTGTGSFELFSSAIASDSGASSRIDDDYTRSGLAHVEFNGSSHEFSQAAATTHINSDTELSTIYSQAIEALYGEAGGSGDVNYTFTNRGDRVAGSFDSHASASSFSASQAYGSITQIVEDGPDITIPIRDNETSSYSVAVTVEGVYEDDSLGAENLGQANVHTESGHVTRIEDISSRLTNYAGLASADDGSGITIPRSLGAYSLGKGTSDIGRYEDYIYEDDGTGLVFRGMFRNTNHSTNESAQSISAAPYDDNDGTTGTYSTRTDGGSRYNSTSTGSYATGPEHAVNSTGTEERQNFAARTAKLTTAADDSAGHRSGSTSSSNSKSSSSSSGHGSTQSDGTTVTGGQGSGDFDSTARGTSSGSSYETSRPTTSTNGDVSTTSASASTSRGSTQGQTTSGGDGTFQQHENNRTDNGDFDSADSGRSGGSGSSADVALVKNTASGSSTLTATTAHGSENGTSQGTSGGTSTSRSGGGANGTSFDVTGNDTSSGNGDSTVTRITAIREPNAASREVVRTTATDHGTLSTNGHAHQQDGATSRDGDYTLGQGGATGLELTSNSNSSNSTGFQFGTLHGTLVNNAGLTGNGDYVTAAQNGGTRQSGTSNTAGHAKLEADGVEGSFSLTTNADGSDQTWSGWLTTSTDTGNGTTNHGGKITVDENGNVTATDLSNSDSGNGQQKTVNYSYSGRYQAPPQSDTLWYDDHQRTDTYTTTTRNTPAENDQPATQSSTDTHEWDSDDVEASIQTTVLYLPGDDQVQLPAFDSWNRMENLSVDRSTGVHSTTVTLAGDQASASITLDANREAGTEWKEAWRYRTYFGSEPTIDTDPERIDSHFGTGSTLESTSEHSEYSSQHSVDSDGHAHGGRFTAHSESVTSSSSEHADYDFTLGAAHSGWTFDEESSKFGDDTTQVRTTTDESGSYEDLVFPFGIAIRVQSGQYDTTQSTDTFSRTGEDTHFLWAGAPEEEPTTEESSTKRETVDDSQTKTTHGWYDVYGNGGSTSKFSQDYEEHKREETDGDYTDFQGNVTHYDGHSTYDVEIHITPDSAEGHGRDAGHGVNSSGPYDYDYPIEFSLTVTPPQNPPANVSNQTLAAQGEEGGGMPGNWPGSPSQTRFQGSEALHLPPADDRWYTLEGLKNRWRRFRDFQRAGAEFYRGVSDDLAGQVEGATATGDTGRLGTAKAMAGGVVAHAIRTLGENAAGTIDFPTTIGNELGETKDVYDKHGAAVAADHILGLRQAAEAAYGTDILTGEQVDAMQKAAEAGGRIGTVAGTAAASAYAFGKPKGVPNPHLEGKTPLPGTRTTGVLRAKAAEVDLVKRTGAGTLDWTPAEIAHIKRTGTLPDGIIGHHINSVTLYPEWAGDPRNIQLLRNQAANLLEHGGNFRNPTTGPLIDR